MHQPLEMLRPPAAAADCSLALPTLACSSLGLLFFFLAGGQPQSTHKNWMKFAGAWGWWTAFLAFYDGIAALLKEVYGRVSRLGIQHWAGACMQGPVAACSLCTREGLLPLPLSACQCPALLLGDHSPPLPSCLQQILPVFPFKPVNKISGGNFGTQRRIDTEDLEQPKA